MKKAIVALPIIASALIVGIVISLLWMAGSASGERAKFSSLEIAPKDADVFVAINTDPTSPQWLAINDSLDAIKTKDRLRRLIDEALAQINLDWEDDILPVAGDEAFFSVPDVSEMEDGGYVAGFRLRDTGKAQEVFDSLRERAKDDGEEFQAEDYEGVTIYYIEGPGIGFDALSGSGGATMFCSGAPDGEQQCACEDEHGTYPVQRAGADGWSCGDSELQGYAGTLSQGGAVALFEDILAVGGSPEDVKMVIDVAQGRAPSAEVNQRLQEFREIQREEFLVWGYADMAQVWDLAEGYADITLEQDPFGFEPADPAPIPSVAPTPAPSVPRDDDFAVRSFDSDIITDSSGSLLVTERIVVDFGDLPKHGIFRDIATKVPYDFEHHELLEIGDVGVTRDGQPDSYEVSRDESYTVVRVGDPDRTITGAHEYVIQYTVHGGIFRFPGVDDGYELAWNVTGDRWSVPIETASATVTVLTGEVLGSSCTVGVAPTETLNVLFSEGCEEGMPSVQSVTVTTDAPIPPGTGLGIRVPVQGTTDALPPVLVERDSFTMGNLEFPNDVPDNPALPFNFDSAGVFEELRGTYDRVGFSVSAAGGGFALDLTVLHAPGFEPKYALEPATVFDSHFASSVPADTMFFFAGYDIYGQTKALGDYLAKIGPSGGPSGEEFLDGFTEATGLDLEEDILSLLTGEYAVAGNASGFENDPPDFNIIAMLDVNDATKARESLDAIGDFLEDEGLVDIDGSDAVQRWKPLGESGVEVLGVTIEGSALIAGYPDKAVEDSVHGFDRPLADTEDWKRTLKLLPQDMTSVGFISLARIFEELRGTEAEESFNQSTDGELTLEDLAAIRFVAFATTSRDNGFGMHFVLFMEDR